MDEETKKAVDDILNGTSTDSVEQWLMREYGRLMEREAKVKKMESNFHKKKQ